MHDVVLDALKPQHQKHCDTVLHTKLNTVQYFNMHACFLMCFY